VALRLQASRERGGKGYIVQNCLRGWGGDMGGHVLRETTSRGLCGLGCPSRTSEWSGYDTTALDIEVDPQCERVRQHTRLKC
jgi:hypothetical protein